MNKIIKIIIPMLLVICLILSFNYPVAAQGNNTQITSEFNFDGSNGGQKIPEGSTIHHLANGTTEVYDLNNSLMLTTNDSISALVMTPNGPMKANHVYGIPNGATIDGGGSGGVVRCYKDNKLVLTVIDDKLNNIANDALNQYSRIPIPGQGTGGWVEDGNASGLSPDTFNALWTCPSSPPAQRSVIIDYLFNGIEDYSGQYLIQPVLQWNVNAGTWIGNCWFVLPGNSYHTPTAVAVSPGQTCEGSMINQGGSNWLITFYNISMGSQISLVVINSNIPLNPPNGNYLITTLESYNTSYGLIYNYDMPGTTTFSTSVTRNGQHPSFNWTGWVNHNNPWFQMTHCSVTTSSNIAVTLITGN
jgi:hypothetical protein